MTDAISPRRTLVFEIRGQLVMVAADVAAAFAVETRQVVQNIKKNPLKLDGRYAFELNESEVESLRSLGVISKAGRGGSRALPWALTQKGVDRRPARGGCESGSRASPRPAKRSAPPAARNFH